MVCYKYKRTLVKRTGGHWGSSACPQKNVWRSQPLKRWLLPFCKTGCISLSSLISTVRRKNWIYNMFSSNFGNVDRKGKSYDDLVCTPKLCPYSTENSVPASAVHQSLAKNNLTLISCLTRNRFVVPVNHTNASLSHNF